MTTLTQPTTDELIGTLRQHGAAPTAKRAADTLAARRDLSAVPALLTMLGAQPKAIRENARHVLCTWGDEPDVRAALHDKLNTVTGQPFTEIIEIVAALQDTDAIPILAARLPGSTRQGQHQIIGALGALKHEAAVPVLIDALSLRGLENKVLRELAQIPGDASLYAIMNVLNDSRTPQRWQAAVRALGQLGDPRAVPTLALMLDHPNRMVRRMALEALGKIGGEDVTKTLVDQLQDEKCDDLDAVLTALQVVGDDSAAPEIAVFLGDFQRTRSDRGSVRRHHAASDTLIALGRNDLVRDWQRQNPLRHALAIWLHIRHSAATLNPFQGLLVVIAVACLVVFIMLYGFAGYRWQAALRWALIPVAVQIGWVTIVTVWGVLTLLHKWITEQWTSHNTGRPTRNSKRG